MKIWFLWIFILNLFHYLKLLLNFLFVLLLNLLNHLKMPINVPLTNNTPSLSRHDLLTWINEATASNHTKIEDLQSGVAYCTLMETIFPGSVGMKKVKCDAKLEHEFIHNLKILQNAFTKITVDKSVPIERLIKGRFQDNFEFLQWFKVFYDSNRDEKENSAASKAVSQRRISKECSSRKSTSDAVVSTTIKDINPTNNSALPQKVIQPPTIIQPITISPKILNPNQEGKHIEMPRPSSPSYAEIMGEQLNGFKQKVEILEIERELYYKKLVSIEQIIKETEEDEGNRALLQKIKIVLY